MKSQSLPFLSPTPPVEMDSSPSPSCKRRRNEDATSDDDAAARHHTRPRTEEEEDDVTDAEVEEFYAILSRIRDASRYLAPRWRPAFSLEDFANPDAVRDNGGLLKEASAAAEEEEEERVAENATPRRLDLNADPEPEENADARK